jgi:hypothetical protein
MKHGTKYSYDQGCRCDECRQATTIARRRFRDRARAQRSPAYLQELAQSREAKRRRHGRCRICGAETSYYGAPGLPVGDRCRRCAAAEQGLGRRGSGPVIQRALAYLVEPHRFSEIRDHLGISRGHTSRLLIGQLLAYGFVERPRRGVYVLSDAGRERLR